MSRLANTQLGILDFGNTINMIMAAFDVYAGRLSPGAFVLVGSLFEQLGSVLEWQSWYMRCYTQATVDVEPLYNMLKTDPIVKQKEDAK
jgi:ABC-type transport system involved in Fe-S cluster assembly fused permease/ATPase subunit